MKTTKISIIISLALIFASVTSAFANSIGDIARNTSPNRGITHQVNVIILSGEQNLCNTYLIEVRDGQGQLVAPAQRYVSGVAKYLFFERGPATGVRIAFLVRANFGDHFICEIELFTAPVYVMGPFLNGQTYRYDLYPNTQPSKE